MSEKKKIVIDLTNHDVPKGYCCPDDEGYRIAWDTEGNRYITSDEPQFSRMTDEEEDAYYDKHRFNRYRPDPALYPDIQVVAYITKRHY